MIYPEEKELDEDQLLNYAHLWLTSNMEFDSTDSFAETFSLLYDFGSDMMGDLQ